MPHEYRRRTDADLPLWPMGFVFMLAAIIGVVYLANVLAVPSTELPPRTVALAGNTEPAEQMEGQSLALDGTVREQWGPMAFTIVDGAGKEMLVVDNSQQQRETVEQGISVSVPPADAHVEGRIYRKQDPELRKLLPQGFDQRLIDDYGGDYIMLANTVREGSSGANEPR